MRREPIAKTEHARNTKMGTHKREFGISPAASHAIPPLDRNYLAFAPKGIASTTTYSQGLKGFLSARRTPCGESLGRSN